MTKYFFEAKYFPFSTLTFRRWLSTRIVFSWSTNWITGRLVSHSASKGFFIWKHFSSQHDHWEEEDREGAGLCLSTIIRSYFLSRCLYPANLPYCIWKVCRIFFFFPFPFGILSYLHSKITWKTQTHRNSHRHSSRVKDVGRSGNLRKSDAPFALSLKRGLLCWPCPVISAVSLGLMNNQGRCLPLTD